MLEIEFKEFFHTFLRGQPKKIWVYYCVCNFYQLCILEWVVLFLIEKEKFYINFEGFVDEEYSISCIMMRVISRTNDVLILFSLSCCMRYDAFNHVSAGLWVLARPVDEDHWGIRVRPYTENMGRGLEWWLVKRIWCKGTVATGTCKYSLWFSCIIITCPSVSPFSYRNTSSVQVFKHGMNSILSFLHPIQVCMW